MGKYIDAAGIKDWKAPQGVSDADWSGWTDDQIEILIENIETQLEETTNDAWVVEPLTMILNGNNKVKLFPKEDGYFKRLVTVTSVKEVDFDGTEKKDFTVGKDFVFDAHKPWFLIWNTGGGRSVRNGTTSVGWPSGQRNIKVEATVGNDGMPKDLQYALCQWITAEGLGPESAGMTAVTGESGKVQEVWEDYTVTYGRSTTNEKRKNYGLSNITGYLPVDRVLSKYINMSSMFSVV